MSCWLIFYSCIAEFVKLVLEEIWMIGESRQKNNQKIEVGFG